MIGPGFTPDRRDVRDTGSAMASRDEVLAMAVVAEDAIDAAAKPR